MLQEPIPGKRPSHPVSADGPVGIELRGVFIKLRKAPRGLRGLKSTMFTKVY